MRPIISALHTGYTSLGTGTTKTQLGGAAVILPSWAKSILAVKPNVNIFDNTTAEAVITSCDVESNDLSLMPFQVLPSPIASTLLGTNVQQYQHKPEIYAMGVQTQGGEQVNVYETALVANTAAPTGGATLIVSNMPAGHPQRHAKIGTLTSTGVTASSDVAGTRYNFSGAKHIIELQAVMAGSLCTTVRGWMGYVKFTSNEFEGVADVKMELNPICGGSGTDISQYVDGTSRQQVDIPVAPGQVNIQDYAFFGVVSPTTAGNFVTGVIYE